MDGVVQEIRTEWKREITAEEIKDPLPEETWDLLTISLSTVKYLVHCIEKGLTPSSDEVQRIIKKHHEFTEQLSHAAPEVYKAMAQLYLEHPEFRKQLDPFHSNLAVFMSNAMIVFADKRPS